MKKIVLAMMLSCFFLSACGGGEEEAPAAEDGAEKPAKKGKKKDKLDAAALAAAESARQEKREAIELSKKQAGVLIIGDTLSIPEGLSSDQGWVGLLDKRLSKSDPIIPVVNASISGETASGGVSRVGWQISKYHPKVVVVAIGSRDMALGTPVDTLQTWLGNVIATAQQAHVKVVLVGVAAPASSTPEYRAAVDAMYAGLASQYKVDFVADLLAPITRSAAVAVDPSVSEAVSSAAVQPAIMENAWPAIYHAIKAAGLATSLPNPTPAPVATTPAVVAPASPPK